MHTLGINQRVNTYTGPTERNGRVGNINKIPVLYSGDSSLNLGPQVSCTDSEVAVFLSSSMQIPG